MHPSGAPQGNPGWADTILLLLVFYFDLDLLYIFCSPLTQAISLLLGADSWLSDSQTATI